MDINLEFSREQIMSSRHEEWYKFTDKFLRSQSYRDRNDIYKPVEVLRYYSPHDIKEHVIVRADIYECNCDPDFDW